CRTPGPGTAARRLPLPRVPHLSPSWTASRAERYRPGSRGRAEKLTRVLEATMNGPLGDRLPAAGGPAAAPRPGRKDVTERATAVLTPLRRRARRNQGLARKWDLSRARGSAGGAGSLAR